MRLVVADYSGHAFPAELSRELARRGCEVLHLYFAEFQSPKGRLTKQADDPSHFAVEPISLGRPFAKHNLVRRRGQEIEIGRRFGTQMAAFGADVVIACNMPLDTIRKIQRQAVRNGLCFIFWQQDIYSVAIENILGRKLGSLGRLIGRYYKAVEKRVLLSSDAVVVISEDFAHYLHRDFGIDLERIRVVENWAPLDEISPRPKDNRWARQHGLSGNKVVLYSGTLGMKHDPALILAVAEDLRGRPDARVVVTSEGPGADWLRHQADALGLPHLKVLNFQPFSDYSDVLASADVLLAILESDSGAFCVPSKVLSYLCAGRPIAMSGPLDNLSARILEQSGGGLTVPPGDAAGLASAIRKFLDQPVLSAQAARGGRAYAEAHFGIADKASQFETILAGCEGRTNKLRRASDRG
jgi:glycosyltransferase involved in cell wall biosynthesis